MVLETENPEAVGHIVRRNSKVGSDADVASKLGLCDFVSALEGKSLPEFRDCLDAIVCWVEALLGSDELVAAREEFFNQTGKVFEADPFYEQRMNYFLEVFLFERRLRKSKFVALHLVGKTPFELFMECMDAGRGETTPELQGRFADLGNHQHSLFCVLKPSRDALVVRNLLTGAKLVLEAKSGENFYGIGKKDIFQAFIYPNGKIFQASRGFIFHPTQASKSIIKSLKQRKKNQEFIEEKVLYNLAKLYVRHYRHRHVDPAQIYSEQTR